MANQLPLNISRPRGRSQGLLHRSDLRRLLIILVFLIGLLLVGRELNRRSAPMPLGPHLPPSAAPAPDLAALANLASSDYQKLGVEENPEALRLLLDWARRRGPAPEGLPTVTFSDLITAPDDYRARGVVVFGQVLRVEQSGIAGVVAEGQLMDSERKIYSFISSSQLAVEKGDLINLYAIFYRVAGYENRQGQIEITPLLIAFGHAPTESPGFSWKAPAIGAGIAVVIGIIILIAARRDAGDRLRFRAAVEKLRAGKSNAESGPRV